MINNESKNIITDTEISTTPIPSACAVGWIAPLPDPIYNEDGITLYCADCTRVLPLLEPTEEDLILSDPPYNMDYHYDIYNDKLMEEDYIKLLQIIKPPAVVIHYPEETINILPKVLGKCSEVVSWAYNNPLPVAKDFRLISWWGIKPDLTKIKVPYATATINDKRAIGKMNTEGKGLRDWWIEETIRFPSHENTEHPCQIPEAIMKKIITVTAGNRIFDPFAGSGTTLVAAKRLGRKAIGIEISEKYCRQTIEWLQETVELF